MWRRLGGLLVISFSMWFLLVPGIRTATVLLDAGARSADIAEIAWSLHETLSPKQEIWAKAWLASERGEQLSVNDISGTEWPLFGSCYYLWATEGLQDRYLAMSHEERHSHREPLEYAREAVNAATNLIIDPKSAGWVRKQWGEDYLKRENVFYRMLLMSAIISQHRITGETAHLDFLREQVEGLALELDASSSGLLDDYPGQCFPSDVVAALAAIKRADSILGTDHSAFLARSLRAFTGEKVRELDLPPFAAVARTGQPLDASRGCANAYLTMQSPIIWPLQSQLWYANFVKYFWQNDWLAAGFREFPQPTGIDWHFDVDSGPVMHGLGFAASAFGLAAARTQGDYERVYPLTAMSIAFSAPLANGTLLLPRLLSNAAEAPYLGESSVLYCLTRIPANPTTINQSFVGWNIPLVVWLILLLELGLGFLWTWKGLRLLIKF